MPPVTSRPFPLRAIILLLTLSLFGCDHATKVAAEASLGGGRSVEVVRGVLELRYAQNDDTAFSLLSHFGVPRVGFVLLGAALLALTSIVALWIASRRRASRLQHVGFALVLAGALGNVLDRARHGYVVDFIHLTRWPIFNVADVGVVAGVVLLGLASLRKREAPPPTLSA